MSFATASSIAQRTAPQEFQAAGTHSGTAQTVPCNVAGNAANVAGNTWGIGHQRQFAIKAGRVGYAAGPFFRFHCSRRRDILIQGRGRSRGPVFRNDPACGEICG
jgi:hypothetical protein